jgi:hypothetical protein
MPYQMILFDNVPLPIYNPSQNHDAMGNPAKRTHFGAVIPALGISISNGARRQGTSAIRVCGQRR